MININIDHSWSVNGNTSFISKFNDAAVFDLFRLSAGTFESGDYTMTLDVYNPNMAISIILFNQSNVSRVNVPASEEVTQVTLTGNITNENYLSCRVSGILSAISYYDNINLQLNE